MVGIILGYKHTISQIFDEKGTRVPTTSIMTSPCYLVNIKTAEKDGYNSIKLGFATSKSIGKPQVEEVKKAGIQTPLHFLKEVRTDYLLEGGKLEVIDKDGKQGIKMADTEVMVGDILNPTVLFEAGDMVYVSGTSKGKGFAGVVKRHKFAGGPKTHGQSDRHRAPGSIGTSATPGRVLKGKKMAGRMGGETVTIKNVSVIQSAEDHIVVKGPIPGPKGSLIIVRTQV